MAGTNGSIYEDTSAAIGDATAILTDLQGSMTNTDGTFVGNYNASTVTDLTNAGTAIGKLNTDLTKVVSDQQVLMTQQDKTKSILDREYNRLASKRQSIDNNIAQQQRMTLLNDTYAARYSAYNYILMITAGVIVVFILLMGAKQMFPAIPDALVNVLSIAIFAFAALYIIYLVYDLNSRDNIDFNKLDQSQMYTPANLRDVSMNFSSSYSSSGTGGTALNTDTCVGQGCCSSGMHFDVNLNSCVDHFTTIGNSGYTVLNSADSGSGSTALAYSKYP